MRVEHPRTPSPDTTSLPILLSVRSKSIDFLSKASLRVIKNIFQGRKDSLGILPDGEVNDSSDTTELNYRKYCRHYPTCSQYDAIL